MKSRDRQTNLAIDFESSRGREETEGGWAKWVSGGKCYSAVVKTVRERRGCGWTTEREMPFEHVVFERVGGIIW